MCISYKHNCLSCRYTLHYIIYRRLKKCKKKMKENYNLKKNIILTIKQGVRILNKCPNYQFYVII